MWQAQVGSAWETYRSENIWINEVTGEALSLHKGSSFAFESQKYMKLTNNNTQL